MMRSLLVFLMIFLGLQGFGQFFFPMAPNADIDAAPKLRWKFKTNGPLVATPVIDSNTVYIGSVDSSLYAIDLATGKLKWQLPTGGSIRSSVALTGPRLFLLSTDGILYLVQSDSGKVNGVFQTLTGVLGDLQRDYADYYTSTPVIRDSIIYFGCAERIYSININDGYLRWIFTANDIVHTTPAFNKNWLFAGSYDGHVYAIDMLTGTEMWKFKTTGNRAFPKGEVMGSPVVALGLVYTGARDFNFYALDTRGGFSSWMRQFSAGWAVSATVNDSVIYVGASDDRALFALDLRSGRELWSVNTGFNIMGGTAVGTRTGYVGTLDGRLLGVDLKKGKLLWTVETDSHKENKLDYFKADGSFRQDIGKILRTPKDLDRMYGKLGGIFSTPVVTGNLIIVGGYDGWVYCFAGE